MEPKQYQLTTTQAANHLGVHRDTIIRWARDGHVPSILTPSGRRYYAQSDLDALTASMIKAATK